MSTQTLHVNPSLPAVLSFSSTLATQLNACKSAHLSSRPSSHHRRSHQKVILVRYLHSLQGLPLFFLEDPSSRRTKDEKVVVVQELAVGSSRQKAAAVGRAGSSMKKKRERKDGKPALCIPQSESPAAGISDQSAIHLNASGQWRQ